MTPRETIFSKRTELKNKMVYESLWDQIRFSNCFLIFFLLKIYLKLAIPDYSLLIFSYNKTVLGMGSYPQTEENYMICIFKSHHYIWLVF